MFSKILVCLDGSKLAEQILPLVEAQARKFESKVILLRIVSPREVQIVEAGATYNDPKILTEQEEKSLEQATSYLNNISLLYKDSSIQVETKVVKASEVARAILSFAEENKVDLIAIATHGRGGLGRLMFGSVASEVLSDSGLPMLLIRPKKL